MSRQPSGYVLGSATGSSGGGGVGGAGVGSGATGGCVTVSGAGSSGPGPGLASAPASLVLDRVASLVLDRVAPASLVRGVSPASFVRRRRRWLLGSGRWGRPGAGCLGAGPGAVPGAGCGRGRWGRLLGAGVGAGWGSGPGWARASNGQAIPTTTRVRSIPAILYMACMYVRALIVIIGLGLAGCRRPADPPRGDPHSFAVPDRVAVRDITLDLTVDFARKTLAGTARLSLTRTAGNEVILDNDGLEISSVDRVRVEAAAAVQARRALASSASR